MHVRAVLMLAVVVALAGCSLGPLGEVPFGEDERVVPDPEGDAVGWVDGYWHNESIAVTNEDGLNESEREAVLARSMARVEYVRGEEFEEPVTVDIIAREEFRDRQTQPVSTDLRTFDNALFEALFLIGADKDSVAVQRDNIDGSVLGYYDAGNESITLVSDSDQPVLDEEVTLGHELTHALQDQRHNLTSYQAETLDGSSAQTALVEGEATLVEREYDDRCGEEWECLGTDESSPSPDDEFHWGVYYLDYFPYSDGPEFAAALRAEGGWQAIDGAFQEPPESTAAVVNPERYLTDAEPVQVKVDDRSGEDWERLRVAEAEQNHTVVGQAALTSAFAYTLHGDDQSLVATEAFYNFDGDRVDEDDPYDYDIGVTQGWAGGRFQVYESPDTGETGYVWRTEWNSTGNAREFAQGYRALLSYWDGERVGGADDTWEIPADENGFAGAYRVDHDGETVTIVHAPSVEELDGVHAEAG